MGNGSGTNQLRKMQWSSGRLPTKPKTGEAVKLQDANNVTLQPYLGHHLDILPDFDPVLLLPHCLVSTNATSFHFCATIMSLLGSHLPTRNWKNPMQRSKQSGHRSKVWQFWQHLRPAAVLSGQFNSSTSAGGLLCTALASSGEKRQEARRAFALRVTRHAIPPSRGADAVHAILAHRCATYMSLFSGWWNITYQGLINLIGQQSLKAFVTSRIGQSCTLFMFFGVFSIIVFVKNIKKYSHVFPWGLVLQCSVSE